MSSQKKIFLTFLFISIFISACDTEKSEIIELKQLITEPNKHSVSVSFSHQVNSQALSLNTSNLPYQNAKGQAFNVSRLRYLISDLTFNKDSGESFTIKDYHLVDASDPASLDYQPEIKVPEGDYTSISFTFGFDRLDNQTGIYPDLNIANWAWPAMLGGGYHFMQLEGNYDSLGTNRFFASHMGTAANNNTSPSTFEANHFDVHIDSSIQINQMRSITVVMNIEEWYTNPYDWDFITYNAPIMPVYDAQRKLNLNGPSVFSLEL